MDEISRRKKSQWLFLRIPLFRCLLLLLVEGTEREQLEEPIKVYNFQVEDFHTYHVRVCGVLVHNANYGNAVGEGIANDIKMEMISNPDNVGSTLVHVSSDGGIDITGLIDGIKQ